MGAHSNSDHDNKQGNVWTAKICRIHRLTAISAQNIVHVLAVTNGNLSVKGVIVQA